MPARWNIIASADYERRGLSANDLDECSSHLMSDGFPSPHSNPQYPPSRSRPIGPDPRNEPHSGGVRLGRAILGS